jgi:hypothetical protein
MKLGTLSPILTIALLSACAEKPVERAKERTDDQTRPQLVGRIASIPADRKFVLILSYGSWSIATGSILTTRGLEGRAANLLATGEKLGQYAAADIQSGTLELGDGVYTVTKIPETQTAEEPPSPEAEVQPAENTTD